MKKITRNQLTNKPVIKIGYCGASFLLKGLERIGYTNGIYGWNADVYETEKAYIITGYRFYGIKGIDGNNYVLECAEKNTERVYNACYGTNINANEIIKVYRDVYIRTLLICNGLGF